MDTNSPPTVKKNRRYRKKRGPRPQQQDEENGAVVGKEEKRPPMENPGSNEKQKKKTKPNVRQEGNEENLAAGGPPKPKPKKRINRRKNKTAGKEQPNEEAPMPPRRQNQPQPVVVRKEKRQVSAMNFVSSVRPKINLVQYRPPPYLMLPPFRCDLTKMTLVKLKNIDPGVDDNGSLLFWAFKHYGWIDNVYVVRRSFENDRPGVAFIGFRNQISADQAISKSGTEQLFGRKIYVYQYERDRPERQVESDRPERQIESNRPKRQQRVPWYKLPPEALRTIFGFLDWRSRIRCELVCNKFRKVAEKMYEIGAPKVPWVGMPDDIGFMFVLRSEEDEAEVFGSGDGNCFKVYVEDVKDLNDKLCSVLSKFSDYIKFLEFHNVTMDSQTFSLIDSAGAYLALSGSRWDAGHVLMKGTVLDDACCDKVMKFINYYGDRLTVLD